LGKLVAKEFCDNALDSSDAAGNPGAVEIEVDESGNLIVTDQGIGIPDATPEGLAALFCVARPMISSKLLRCPSRGAVGNGLRACLGFLTATRGFLIVETGTVGLRLVPQMDGTAQIVSSEVVSARRGLRLIAVAVDTPFTSSDLVWARDAIDLAQQSGQPAFTGKPSPTLA
jgi:hypothetical protein